MQIFSIVYHLGINSHILTGLCEKKIRLLYFIFPVIKIYTVLLYDVLNKIDAKLALSTVKPVLSDHSKIDKKNT